MSSATSGKAKDDRAVAMTADVDRSGFRWFLGAWAVMTIETIGRQSTTRGMIDGVGKGGRVVVDVGECDLCNELFSGGLVVGEDPMPPGHPSCGCLAAPA